jgi:hypothetical protein
MARTTDQQIKAIANFINITQTGLSTLHAEKAKLQAKEAELEGRILEKQKRLEDLQAWFDAACGEENIYCPACQMLVHKEFLISQIHESTVTTEDRQIRDAQITEFLCPHCESLLNRTVLV